LPRNTRLPLGSHWRNIENIEQSLSYIILPVCLADRLYLSVAVTGDKYCTLDQVQVGRRKLIIIYVKFAVVSGRIWQTGPLSLEKFAVNNCGPYLSLINRLTNITLHQKTDSAPSIKRV